MLGDSNIFRLNKSPKFRVRKDQLLIASNHNFAVEFISGSRSSFFGKI